MNRCTGRKLATPRKNPVEVVKHFKRQERLKDIEISEHRGESRIDERKGSAGEEGTVRIKFTFQMTELCTKCFTRSIKPGVVPGVVERADAVQDLRGEFDIGPVPRAFGFREIVT